ncbi:MAG: oxidoreductase [Bryobacterales bacterium]|nr:oxidoreductase [Bryobacterales bacterium]
MSKRWEPALIAEEALAAKSYGISVESRASRLKRVVEGHSNIMGHNGKIALVTGAGSGIGRAAALTLQSAGYTVVVAGRRAEALHSTVAMADESGGRMVAVPTDVAAPASVNALFGKIRDDFKRLDVLFNNAGLNAPGIPIEDLSYEMWCSIVDVNLTGAFLCAQAAFRLMKDQRPRGGRIINNGSIAAFAPRPNHVPYTSTKHAITGMTKCFSLDGRKYDIACSQLDIGNAATEMTERLRDGVMQADGTTMEEPRMDLKHVADAVLYISNLPLDANVQYMTLMATKMPLVGRG